MKYIFGQDFETEVWSSFWSWSLIEWWSLILINLCNELKAFTLIRALSPWFAFGNVSFILESHEKVQIILGKIRCIFENLRLAMFMNKQIKLNTDLWRRGSNTVAGYLLRDIANGHKHTREFPCFDRSRLKTNHYNWAWRLRPLQVKIRSALKSIKHHQHRKFERAAITRNWKLEPLWYQLQKGKYFQCICLISVST